MRSEPLVLTSRGGMDVSFMGIGLVVSQAGNHQGNRIVTGMLESSCA